MLPFVSYHLEQPDAEVRGAAAELASELTHEHAEHAVLAAVGQRVRKPTLAELRKSLGGGGAARKDVVPMDGIVWRVAAAVRKSVTVPLPSVTDHDWSVVGA